MTIPAGRVAVNTRVECLGIEAVILTIKVFSAFLTRWGYTFLSLETLGGRVLAYVGESLLRL